MGSKQVDIAFTREQVADFNTQGFKLCFTAGVGDNPAYNVIAWCDTVGARVNISWKEAYQIAATKDTFMNGVKFSVSTTPAGIDFQNVYTLPPDWTDGSLSPDSTLGKTSFKFSNQTNDKVSCVVYKSIKGRPTPFYISQSPVYSRGTETLTPKLTVALWMQKDAETGTMISINKGMVAEFDMGNTDSANLVWNGSRFITA